FSALFCRFCRAWVLRYCFFFFRGFFLLFFVVFGFGFSGFLPSQKPYKCKRRGRFRISSVLIILFSFPVFFPLICTQKCFFIMKNLHITNSRFITYKDDFLTVDVLGGVDLSQVERMVCTLRIS